jgi:hypothetical protein
VGHATITNCTVTAYQKVGIIIGRSGSLGPITGCTITGVGPTPLIAQNGIQIGPETAAGAAVSNCTISGNEYTGSGPPPRGPDPTASTQSAGILNFIDSCSITGNTIFANDQGIYSTVIGSTSTGTTISGNTVRDNRFEDIELAAGTATVSNNTVTGSNIGVAVIAAVLDQFGNPVTLYAQGTLISNNITNNGNGGLAFPGGGILVLVQAGASTTAHATANCNRIVGNSVGLDNGTTATVDATNNWWGSNAGPGGAGSDTVSGPLTFNPWLVLQVTASPTSVVEGGVATVVADLTKDNVGTDTSALGHVSDGIPVSFGTTTGTIVPAMGFTAAGQAAAQFTAGDTPGTATVSATVDHQTSTATSTIAAPPRDTIGVFDPTTGTWYLRNEANAGPPDAGQFQYGGVGWIPVVGDWNGHGAMTVGVVDPSTMTWYLRNSNSAGPPDFAHFSFGGIGWKPVVGDWDGNGTTTVGVIDPAGQFGQTPATWYLRNSNSAGAPDIAPFSYGGIGWVPVAGIWTDPPRSLHVLGGGVRGVSGGNLLTWDTANALEVQEVARLQQDGVRAAVVSRLAAVEVEFGRLAGRVLSTADPQSRRVLLDASAAGHGWFVDPTPLQDEEFVAGPAGQPQTATPGGPADGRVDLLTALLQEMGVAAGLDDANLRTALAPSMRDVADLDAFFATL